jgi:hypothetical protein
VKSSKINYRIKRKDNVKHSKAPFEERTIARIYHESDPYPNDGFLVEEVIELMDARGNTVAYVQEPGDAKLFIAAPEMCDALYVALDALRELATSVAFDDESPEFNEEGVGYEAIQTLWKVIAKIEE